MKTPLGTPSFIPAVLLWSAIPTAPALGCTVFNVVDQGRTFVGANEDWTNDRYQLWVRPADGRQHGFVVWGVDDAEKYPFAGFNDRGLFFDLASARPAQPPKPDPGKETHENTIYVRMLANCATVAEAVEFLGRFNIAGLARHHVMVVDRSGDSAVIEDGGEGQVVIRKQGRHQVMENSPLSTAAGPPPSSGRYATATRMLTDLPAVSFDALRDILRATTNSSPRYPTVFSYVVDLATLRFRFYHRANFEACFEGDAVAEFAKGEHRVRLTERFSAQPLTPSGESALAAWGRGNTARAIEIPARRHAPRDSPVAVSS